MIIVAHMGEGVSAISAKGWIHCRAKIGHEMGGGVLFLKKKVILQTWRLQQQSERIAIILKLIVPRWAINALWALVLAPTRHVLTGQIPPRNNNPWVIDNNCVKYHPLLRDPWKVMVCHYVSKHRPDSYDILSIHFTHYAFVKTILLITCEKTTSKHPILELKIRKYCLLLYLKTDQMIYI